MESNPQLRALMDRNPQLRHALSDPATLRQTMQMMRNPAGEPYWPSVGRATPFGGAMAL